MQSIDIAVDVTEAAGLGEPLRTRATVTLPDPSHLPSRPIVCFAFPGGGYSRQYFTFDMPGATGGGQAGWHAARGWVFVSCDHLHVGESDSPQQPGLLTLESVAAANAATVEGVLSQLATGTLHDSFPPVADPVRLGIGQSLGGGLTIVQQGQHATYDGVGILGYSAQHTVLAVPPGTPRLPWPYVPRGSLTIQVMSATSTEGVPEFTTRDDGLPISTWGFHYDDEPEALVRADMVDWPTRNGQVPVWGSATMPPCSITMMSPGVVALEASVIRVPVLVAVGERDVCPRPLTEPSAYPAATDVSVFICPRMAHMHNFASTRQTLWRRIETWGQWVASAAEPGS